MMETVTRAFELPIQRVEDVAGVLTSAEVWTILRECNRQAVDLANWCVRWLQRQEPLRLPGAKLQKFPALPKGGLYAVAGREFGLTSGCWWSGQAGSFSSVTQTVWKYWMGARFAVLVRGTEQARCWRSYPFPIRAQEWTAAGFREGNPYVEINLPSGTPRKAIRARVWLRAGSEFGRQISQLRQTIANWDGRKELVLRHQPATRSCHRPTRGGSRWLVKMVADIPVREKPGDRCLVLLTDPEAFWVAELDDRRAWLHHTEEAPRITRTRRTDCNSHTESTKCQH